MGGNEWWKVGKEVEADEMEIRGGIQERRGRI